MILFVGSHQRRLFLQFGNAKFPSKVKNILIFSAFSSFGIKCNKVQFSSLEAISGTFHSQLCFESLFLVSTVTVFYSFISDGLM
jgi:hypothetical protein